MKNTGFNRRWASVIVEALSRHRVRHVCIAPGSRSTPLTLAAATHPVLQCHTHFDERGLGHLALGLAKASGEAVAIIVTSGTALANLYPAVIEAKLTGEKLVLLTADRPPELIDCGANQAIVQPGIFAGHVTATLNLPRPTEDIAACWLVSALDTLLGQQQHGAVHINCPFADPLYGEDDGAGNDWLQALGDWWQSTAPWLHVQAATQINAQADWPHWRTKNGVVLAGRLHASQGVRLAHWADQLGWPLIGDVLSQTGQPLAAADIWLNTPTAQQTLAQAGFVIQFGSHLTGKRLLQWQAACQPQEYWLIDPLPGRRNPAQHRGRRLVADIDQWLDLHPAVPRSPWTDGLTTLAKHTRQRIRQNLADFSEASVAHRLARLLPNQGQLFIGNSLFIRLVDALAQLPAGYPVYANRGASGIDGLIATAAGVQRATARPTLAVIGDLSALYDINSLALLRQPRVPFVLIIVNNNGGQIFSLLDTPADVRQRFYCMPQQVDFRHAAALFGLSYQQPESWPQLCMAVEQAFASVQPVSTCIELRLPAEQGAQQFRQLVTQQLTAQPS